MNLDEVQQKAMETYELNMKFLENHDNVLFKKLKTFEEAINTNQITPIYSLEYKEDYFDLLINQNNTFYYGENSIDYSDRIVKEKLIFDEEKNSFKAFYDLKFHEDVVKTGRTCNAFSAPDIFISPISHYVNTNLPEKKVMSSIKKFIIFGVGLGLHIPKIHKKLKSYVYLIIEPNLELFRLSLFVTNYADLAKESKLIFSIADTQEVFRLKFNTFYTSEFIYNNYLKFFMFFKEHDFYTRVIQEALVSQSHILYSYNRLLKSLQRTVSYINQDLRILNINGIKSLEFSAKPILLLGAGPSLQKNLEFVKKNHGKYIIVALYVIMPFLEKHGIVPDIITQYDEADAPVMKTVKEIQNLEFFKNTIFLFSSHIDEKLMNTFNHENIYVYQAMFTYKHKHGFFTAPSIGEISYALLVKLGAQNITLLGLDFALDSETNATHIDGHTGFNIDNAKEDSFEKFTLRNSLIKVKGNFVDEVTTTPVFKVSMYQFNRITQDSNNHCIVNNLSNGAYLEGTNPVKAEDIDMDAFVDINKVELKELITENLTGISDVGLNDEERDYLQVRYDAALEIKKLTDSFAAIKKDSNVDGYTNRIIDYIQFIIYKKHACDDLVSILRNYMQYSFHYVFHLFNIQGLPNSKRHIKQIHKELSLQLRKIVDTYVHMCKIEKK